MPGELKIQGKKKQEEVRKLRGSTNMKALAGYVNCEILLY